MSLYGNITDTSKTAFQFDKIYANRYSMDMDAQNGNDGIYAGRFVLIKYDPDGKYFESNMLAGYLDISNNRIYVDSTYNYPYRFTSFTAVQNPDVEDWETYYYKDGDDYYPLIASQYFNQNTQYYTTTTSGNNLVYINQFVRLYDNQTKNITNIYYKCVGQDPEAENNEAIFERVADGTENSSTYITNYNIDKNRYGLDFDIRGYDATVWQKIYSQGNGKFILIAYLNALVPNFDFYPEPPSEFPVSAYIDGKSTNALYRIHLPSSWGFQFKEDEPVADGGYSEEKIIQNTRIYANDGSYTEGTPREIDADIYINKAGLTSISKRERDNTTLNKIELTPTGISGRKYVQEDGTLDTEIDTMELSVHLPAIGNAVSDVYDVLYDYDIETKDRYTDIQWMDGKVSDEIKYNGLENKKTHNLETIAGTLNTLHDRLGQIVVHLESWPTDLEMANISNDYIYEFEGKYYRRGIKYNPITIGNYFYKLYIPPTGQTTESNFAPGEFYYKVGNSYILEEIEYNSAHEPYYQLESWCTFTEDQNVSTQFEINKYYIENNGTYIPYTGDTYDSSIDHYYLKNINTSRYQPIILEEYEPDEFYYKQGDDYICDHSDPNPTDLQRKYYDIADNIPRVTGLEGEYQSGLYWKKFVDSELEIEFYELITSATMPQDINKFYTLNNFTWYTTLAHQGQENETTSVYLYMPNIYYYLDKEESQSENPDYSKLKLLDIDELLSSHTYNVNNREELLTFAIDVYILEFEKQPRYGKDASGNVFMYYPAIISDNMSDQIINEDLYFMDSNNKYFYRQYDNEYIQPTFVIPVEDLGKIGNNYPDLDLDPAIRENPFFTKRIYYYYTPADEDTTIENNYLTKDQLYVPNKYYVYDSQTYNYVLSRGNFDEQINISPGYLILNETNVTPIDNPFYISGKYYYQDANEPNLYHIDYGEDKTNGRTYFVQAKYYVDEDTYNECPHGYEWNENAAFIPPSITLYMREEYLDLIQMDYVYEETTRQPSINNSLLYLHQAYDPLNDETRDKTSFRGALNAIQDLLYQIRELRPGHICYVNNFGQITSSDITYDQLKALIN